MPLYVGLMSGTSMDAVDAVLAEVDEHGVRVRHRHETPIPEPLAQRMRAALDSEHLGAIEFWRLDREIGALFARAAVALLDAADVPAADVAAIGSHGQTLYHAPGAAVPVTVQAGDPNVIALTTGIVTVADFRRMDVAAGGQGAPLAPAFHAFAFGSAEEARVVLNVGGIANVTVLERGEAHARAGFDIGPGNTLMDVWAQEHLGCGYDEDGRWAGGGHCDHALLATLRDDPYFARPPPKSTGREHFNRAWLGRALTRHPGVEPRDVQRTLLELTASTVADAIGTHAAHARALYACGGGAANRALMAALAARLPGVVVASTDALGVAPRCVEGAAFAWLAHLRLAGHAPPLAQVTGASRPVVLGGVYRA